MVFFQALLVGSQLLPSKDFFTLFHPHFKQLLSLLTSSLDSKLTPFIVHLLSLYSSLYLSPDD
jgi:hypothetical protein